MLKDQKGHIALSWQVLNPGSVPHRPRVFLFFCIGAIDAKRFGTYGIYDRNSSLLIFIRFTSSKTVAIAAGFDNSRQYLFLPPSAEIVRFVFVFSLSCRAAFFANALDNVFLPFSFLPGDFFGAWAGSFFKGQETI